MELLQPPDSLHLNAALGWLELGNHLEANAELEEIAPALRSHPAVLELRWQIYAKAEKWDACLDIANAVIAGMPERVDSWLNRAYSIRRATGGSVQAAYDALLPASKRFPHRPTVPYNLACYACQLGQLKDAWAWLEKAFALGNADKIKLMALDDNDLEPLWAEIGEV